MFSEKNLKLITKILLLSVVAIVPFLKTNSLYFPYVSGKVYIFRLLVMLAFFFWVWLLLKNKEYKPNFKNILIISLVLFFLAQAISSFFGVDPLLSFFSTIERGDGVLQYGFWLLYFLILISVFRKEQDWKLFFYVFIIVAVLLSVYSWFNYNTQIRLSAIFGNSSYLAVFLIFAVGFAAIILERKFFKEYFLNLLLVLSAIFLTITLIATQTRGAYAGLAGGIFLFCFLGLFFLRKENKKLAFFCGIILFLGLVSMTTLFAARETDFVQNTYILKRTASVANFWEDDVVRERLLVWQIALNAFKERPVFGWGPENFGSAFNKHYDYRVGIAEPWFDRAHSQPIDTLATGGIFVFSFYLFWLISTIFLIFKISRPCRVPTKSRTLDGVGRSSMESGAKEKKVLSFILASIFLAYFVQGIFLFDMFAVYLGLFPFLAFVVFQYNSRLRPASFANGADAAGKQGFLLRQGFSGQVGGQANLYILVPAALFSLFVIYATCFVPYKANASALKFYALTKSGFYQEAKPFLEQSFAIKSPYTFWEIRKRTAWQLVNILEYDLRETTSPDDIQMLKEFYDFITPELEKFAENKPYEPQIYYILGRIYRFGFEKLGRNDLDKAERILKKGFNYSDCRAEYFNELARILVLEGKFEEGENLVKGHIRRITSDIYFPYITLGHFYFVAGKYDLAWEQYEKAREIGYKFYENNIDYSRYLSTAEQLSEYQKIVDMALTHLERWGPDADTFFNIAVGYLNLEEKEKTREFFLKAVELKEEYEEYRLFFAP